MPEVKKVKYFSDGAASQYKNFKNFSNLMRHESDFKLAAEWHFFATSHGKSVCDGIGGTIKRLASRKSLQAATADHILTPQDLFAWASLNVTGIKCFFVSSAEVSRFVDEQEKRFKSAKKVTGTRSHHCFLPAADGNLLISRISGDENKTTVKLNDTVTDINSWVQGSYVAAVYDRKWYIGIITEVNYKEEDVCMSFMRRVGKSNYSVSYTWCVTVGSRDECIVPVGHLLKTIAAPTTPTGRQYTFVRKDIDGIVKSFQEFSVTHFH